MGNYDCLQNSRLSKQTTVLYIIVVVIFVGQIFILNFFRNNETQLFTEQIQILKKQTDTVNNVISNKVLLIENDIKRIEQINDKRFECWVGV